MTVVNTKQLQIAALLITLLGVLPIGVIYAADRYYTHESAKRDNMAKIINAPIDEGDVEIRVFTPDKPQRFESTCRLDTPAQCQLDWNKDCARMFGQGVWEFYATSDQRPGCKNLDYDGRILYIGELIW